MYTRKWRGGRDFNHRSNRCFLRIKVYKFLALNGPACLRDICEALGESPSNVVTVLGVYGRKAWF